MRSDRFRLTALLLAALGAGCSDDAPEFSFASGPEEFTRDLPEFGGARPGGDGGISDAAPTRFDIFDAGPCCSVTFTLPAKDEAADSVVLRGDLPPLDGLAGTPLTLDDGTWSVSLCVPQDYNGIYYFEVALPPEDADGGVVEGSEDLFITTRHNEDAPVGEDPLLGLVNTLLPRDTCE